MHEGIRGEVYLGGCPRSLDLKDELKDFLAEEDFLVVDLGSFEIDEQADCGVLAREVGEKVVEGVLFNQDGYAEQGLKVFGILIDSEQDILKDELLKLEGIKPASLFVNQLSEANVLLLSGDEDLEDIKDALRTYYAA